jgi:transposase
VADVDPRDARIAQLEAQVAALTEQLTRALARIAQQDARIEELEAQLRRTSQNSSQPPSSDPPGTARPKTPPTGRRPGGQPGHKGTKRELLPVEEVDEVVVLRPQACNGCGSALVDGVDGPAPVRHQVTEVPPIQPHVTEYQRCAGYCTRCEEWTVAALPPGTPAGAFGVRLVSLITLLTGRFRLSKRLVQEMLSTVLGVELALGSVSNQEQQMSAALASQYEEARAFVRQQSQAHLDETGWRERMRRAWLWTVVTAQVSVFLISRSRGGRVVKALLGEDFTGFTITDRWSAYSCHDAGLRQLCWSHLKRDWRAFIDGGGRAAPLGDALLHQQRLAFGWYHRARDGTLRWETFQRRMQAVRREVGRLLRRVQGCASSPRAAGMARAILQHEVALWTFVDVPDVAPTNNAAERALRPAVLWRKTSFGTHSEEGSRFVERMLTAVTTLRQQQRHVLEHLVLTYDAHLRGLPGPSLLPARAG